MTYSATVTSLLSHELSPPNDFASSSNKHRVYSSSAVHKLTTPSDAGESSNTDMSSKDFVPNWIAKTTATVKQHTSPTKTTKIVRNHQTTMSHRAPATPPQGTPTYLHTEKASILRSTTSSTKEANPFPSQTTIKDKTTTIILKKPAIPDTKMSHTPNHQAMAQSSTPFTTESKSDLKNVPVTVRNPPQSPEVREVTVLLETLASTANVDKVNKAISTVMAEQISQCQKGSDVIVQAADTESLPTSRYSFTLTCSGEIVSSQDIISVLDNKKSVEEINHLLQKELGDTPTGPANNHSSISIPILAGAGGGCAVLVVVVMVLVFRRSTRHKRKRAGSREGDPVVFNNPMYGKSRA